MLYIKAEFHVYPGKMATYCELMNELIPVMATLGWKLVAGFVNDSGRQRDITNLWQVRDANTYTSFRANLMKVPGGVELIERIRACFDAEEITLINPTEYSPEPFNPH